MGKKKGLQRLLTVILLAAFLITLTSGVLAEEISATKPEAQAAETVETQPVETEAGTTAAETAPAETTAVETTPAETAPAETTAVETTPAETTAVETTAAGTAPAEQELTAAIYTDGNYETLLSDTENYDGTTITLDGMMPVGATVKAYPVSVQIDEFTVYAAYDITIFDADGSKYEPDAAANGAISVSIDTPALESVEEADVYHIETADVPKTETLPELSDAETVEATVIDPTDTEAAPQTVTAEKVDTVETKDTKAEFDAESFSIYVVGHSTETIGRSEGNPYVVAPGSTLTLTTDINADYYSWQQKKRSGSGFSDTWDLTLDDGYYTNTCTVTIPGTVTIGNTYRIGCKDYFAGSYSDYFYLKIAAQSVTITDTIFTNGLLNAVVKDSSGNTVTGDALNDYTFTWTYNGTTVTPANDVRNDWLPNNGQSVNVAYAGGATESGDATYTLTVMKNGITYGTASATVSYAMQLLNGSFEEPEMNSSTSHIQTSTVPNWKTTGRLSDGTPDTIELVNGRYTGTFNSKNYGESSAEDQDQFAELNSESAGTLYQDVLTLPGSNLYWQLAHEARHTSDNEEKGYSDAQLHDTMYLVIVPTSVATANNLTTQDSVSQYILAKTGRNISTYYGTDGQVTLLNADGIQIVRITDNASGWIVRNSDSAYSVPSGQYLTRFFFVSGKTAYDNCKNPALPYTIGNLLDCVSFSQNIPYSVEYYVNNVKQSFTDGGTVNPTVGMTADASSMTHYAALNSTYTLVKTQVGDGTTFTNYGTTTAWSVRDGKTIMQVYFVTKTTSLTVHKTFAGLTQDNIPDAGISVTFTLDGGGSQTLTVDRGDFAAGSDYTVTFTNVAIGSHIVKETCSLSGYGIVTTVGTAASPTGAYDTANGYSVSIPSTTPVSVYFKNTYEKLQEADDTYITVRKQFCGLSDAQFADLISANQFTVTVTAPDGTVYTLKPGAGSSEHVSATVDSDAKTIVWKLGGLSTGTYTVAESNAEVVGLSLTATGSGSVTTKVSDMEITQISKVSNCNQNDYQIGAVNMIVAKLTQSQGYFVWTSKTLSASERVKVIAFINTDTNLNPAADASNTYFYSGNVLSQTSGLYFRESYIYYNGTDTLHFSKPQQWTMFLTANYTLTDSADPEITLTNRYNVPYMLPKAGGMGTTVFRVVGIVILVAAAAALVAYLTRGKRKKQGKHKA